MAADMLTNLVRDHIADFNAITSNSYEPEAHEELLNIMQNNPLVQMQKQPTRNENNLDLFLTNNESLVKSTSIIPGISDQDIVIIDSIIRPKIAKAAKRKNYKWYSVYWIEINENLSQFKQTLNWHELKHHINKLIKIDTITHKWSSTRYNLSWFNRYLTRMTKCKQILYNKAKQTQNHADWYINDTTSAIRKAHNEYVEHKLVRGLEEGSTKSFWRYVKSLRKDNSGISSLKQDGKLYNDSKDKAEILNNQFKSVYTQQSASEIPEQGPRTPNLPP